VKPRRKPKPSTKPSTSAPATRRPRLPKRDEVEQVSLGKKPVLERVHGARDKFGKPMLLFNAKLKEQYEWRAKGKAVQELVGMTKDSGAAEQEKLATLESRFGTDVIAHRDGTLHKRRLDEIEELEASNTGWGSKPTKIMTTVPALPWQADRKPGERYEDYKRRHEAAS
jgi:hypothetical protein